MPFSAQATCGGRQERKLVQLLDRASPREPLGNPVLPQNIRRVLTPYNPWTDYPRRILESPAPSVFFREFLERPTPVSPAQA